MGLLDIFRPKPKPCTGCGREVRGRHQVYSGLRHGALVDELCTDCLLSRLEEEIRGRRIVWIEPLTRDGYCYSPYGEIENEGLTEERVKLALASLGGQCADCGAEPHHLWMPLGDLDEEAMEKQEQYKYFQIPLKPADWQGTVPLCDQHAVARLRADVEAKGYVFLTFRFPAGGNEGYYS